MGMDDMDQRPPVSVDIERWRHGRRAVDLFKLPGEVENGDEYRGFMEMAEVAIGLMRDQAAEPEEGWEVHDMNMRETARQSFRANYYMTEGEDGYLAAKMSFAYAVMEYGFWMDHRDLGGAFLGNFLGEFDGLVQEYAELGEVLQIISEGVGVDRSAGEVFGQLMGYMRFMHVGVLGLVDLKEVSHQHPFCLWR